MGTRSGDLDAGILQYVMNKYGININEMLNILNKKSGVQGVSGVSSDFVIMAGPALSREGPPPPIPTNEELMIATGWRHPWRNPNSASSQARNRVPTTSPSRR